MKESGWSEDVTATSVVGAGAAAPAAATLTPLAEPLQWLVRAQAEAGQCSQSAAPGTRDAPAIAADEAAWA
ncbi:MAG: hypothetical protein A2085_08050 [Gemmatimonadetes bacterium GWC2_71_10]|nr:MAG: hypothetical protein A2085_08050 [Gemmatimonadetes bacterium GWC2_71_10]